MIKTALALFLAALLVGPGATGQSCNLFPAECPINGVDEYGTADDSIARLANPIIPQEIAMENRLRRWTASLLKNIADKQGWQLVQLSEVTSSGFRTPDGSILPYAQRPPHWYYTTWEFIVNPDSLQAWRTWLGQFAQQRMDQVAHYNASQMESSAAAANAERKRRTIHYRDACLLIVELGFNMDYAKTAGAPAGPFTNAPLWFHNADPDLQSTDLLDHSRTSVLLLEGSWNRKPDADGGYRPNKYAAGQIKCDQVQTLDCHLSGNPTAMQQFLSLLPRDEMAALLHLPLPE